ncbi:cache domain-containing protein [Desulfurivibrio sp. D14AmB]|uniref:cache domain-containing protein n=1 Tax=Desulfurivibrio sp. D14AmB TaxID=3374370 RepID=UPI00376EBC5F
MNTENSFNCGRHDYLRFLLPAGLALLILLGSLFGFFAPAYQDLLLAKKKEGARELTQAVLGVLAHQEARVAAGELSLALAQAEGAELVRAMRYGREGKDYFWINDLAPRMIMHPYRPELEGRDLGELADLNGKHLFREFVAVARRDGGGYVPYTWQWHDQPERQEAKLSHIQLFAPWEWIVGTGVYLDEERRQVAAVTRRLGYLVLGVLGVVLLLAVHVVRHGLRTAARRRQAEAEVRRHEEHLEELIAQRTQQLTKALAEVKQLSGLLPICASCKKIRDDEGFWQQVEVYIRDRSQAQFSHGICPDCAQKLYPQLFAEPTRK